MAFNVFVFASVISSVLSHSANAAAPLCTMQRFDQYSGRILKTYSDIDFSDCRRAREYCEEDLVKADSGSRGIREKCIYSTESIYSGRADYQLFYRGDLLASHSLSRFDTDARYARAFAEQDTLWECLDDLKSHAANSGDPVRYETESECLEK